MERETFRSVEWGGQPVAIRPASGKVYLLVSVRKDGCSICRYGVRFETLWAAASGEMNQLSWCRSCFNADWEQVEADACAGPAGLVRGIDPEALPHYWPGARPAIEDLERRGLV